MVSQALKIGNNYLCIFVDIPLIAGTPISPIEIGL
jgi:hypothetical protein